MNASRFLSLSILFIAIFVASTIFAPVAIDAACSVNAVNLCCEYLDNPLGIDVQTPRLSWQLQAVDDGARGQRQTAYRILVAGDESSLQANTGDLWDSGWVESGQSMLVEYGGKPLVSTMPCYWKVQVRDEDGETSDWSAAAHWSMGLLERSDWNAKWIGIDQSFERQRGSRSSENTIPDPWYRKTFTLDKAPQRATIYVASVGYHELYVNGEKVNDSILVPSVANHRVRARYITYDITKHLKQGQNAVAFWQGLSWSIFSQYKRDDKPNSPIVMAQCDIALPGGNKVQVVTDASWKTHPSPNTLLGVWDFMNYGGELYDANKEVPDWNTADFDDSSWKAVTVYSPDLKISAEMIEPNRKIQPIEPISVEKVGNGDYRVDMGVNYTGWVEIDVKGKPGQRIDFQFSEREDQAMTHRLHSAYIIGPSGEGTFHNHFNYLAGRWIQIKGLDAKPALSDMRGFLVHTDYARAGHFRSTNDLLNRIYDTTLWTYECLSLGGYVVDCAQRERMGYGGDAHATTECGLNNYGQGAFYTKWSQDWRDVQGEDGNLPYTAPTYWGGGGPGWSGYCITLPWNLYNRYGDVRILETNFDTIQRWLAFLETKSKDNLLVRWGGQWDFLGDWLWPGARGTNGDYPGTLHLNNCYWVYNLDTAAKIAAILGKNDIADAYNARADEVRQAINKRFYNPEDGSYVNGFEAYQAIALFANVPPEKQRDAVWKRLEDEIMVYRKGHIHAGITGGAFLYKTLLKYDKQNLLYAMGSKDDYPGWGDMLNRGATTIWEDWEGRQSLSHSSYLYIGTWFIEGLGGIKLDPEVPGFKQFVLKPPLLDGNPLKEVDAQYDSIYGTIQSEWSFRSGKCTYNITVPPNTTATVYVPGAERGAVKESGLAADSVDGLEWLRDENGYVVFKAQPGSYSFVSDMK